MGADERDLAIATVVTRYPDLWDRFYFDLHDGMYWAVPRTWTVSYLVDVLRTLDTIDYEAFWGVDPPVPYVWEGSLGPDWGHKVDFDYDSDGSLTLEQYYNKETKTT